MRKYTYPLNWVNKNLFNGSLVVNMIFYSKEQRSKIGRFVFVSIHSHLLSRAARTGSEMEVGQVPWPSLLVT